LPHSSSVTLESWRLIIRSGAGIGCMVRSQKLL